MLFFEKLILCISPSLTIFIYTLWEHPTDEMDIFRGGFWDGTVNVVVDSWLCNVLDSELISFAIASSLWRLHLIFFAACLNFALPPTGIVLLPSEIIFIRIRNHKNLTWRRFFHPERFMRRIFYSFWKETYIFCKILIISKKILGCSYFLQNLRKTIRSFDTKVFEKYFYGRKRTYFSFRKYI